MKKDNENPYRPYRVVSVKKIDRWFFEKHDHRRTHAKIYHSIIQPKFGICENTFLDYRHESDELLELFRQSVNVEFSMWLPTMEAKYMMRLTRLLNVYSKRNRPAGYMPKSY